MKLKERLITLRIGKGLVSLLALFVMLLTPHEAWAEDYNLSVAGIPVTSDNAANVLGEVDEETELPTVVFDAENNELTLRNAYIEVESEDAIVSSLENLTVFLVGENTIFCYGDRMFNKTSAVDEAIITFTTDEESNGSLYFMCGEEQIFGEGVTPFYTNLSLKHDGDSHYIDSSLGLSVAGVAVTPFNQSNVLGTPEGTTPTVSFTPAVSSPASPAKLTLNNASFDGTISWENPADLTVEILGSNTIDTNYGAFLEGNENASLTLTTNSSAPGHLLLTSCYHYSELSGWNNLSDLLYYPDNSDGNANDYDWWVDVSTSDQSLLMFNTKYDLWVDDIRLCSAQKEIKYGQFEGSNSISFDGDHTLTFNNVYANTENSPFITNGLSELIISLREENTVNCGQLFLDKKDGDSNHNVTFMSNEDVAGTLVITTTGDEDDPWYSGHNTPTISRLVFTDEMSNDVRTLTFSEPTPYDLTVCDVTVTNANANAIQNEDSEYISVAEGGSITFDAQTSTLTLDNATLRHGISSGLANLTIKFKGTNQVNTDGQSQTWSVQQAASQNAISTEVETATLTFEKDGDGSVELYGKTYSAISGFASVGYSSGDSQCYLHTSKPSKYDVTDKYLANIYDGGSITNATVSSETAYPLWFINSSEQGTQVTSTTVTASAIEKGTVTFTPANNTLSLNGVTMEGKILSGVGNLTIDITGANYIATEDSGSVVRSTNSGTLTIKKTGDKASLQLNCPDDELNSFPVIQGFTAFSNSGLNMIADEDATYGEYILWDYDGDDDDVKIYGLYNPNMSEGYDKRITSVLFTTATYYPLLIAGNQVTSENADAITGENFTGTVTYNNETHTLTLDNVTIDLTDEENEGPGIKYSGTANLIIVLNGNNSIQVQSGCEPIIYDAEEVPPTVPTLTFERGSHPCSLELQGVNSPVIKYFGNVLGVNGINDVTGNFLKLDSETAVAYSQTDGLHTVVDNEAEPVTSATIVSFLLDPKFCFSTSANSAIPDGGTSHYTYGEEQTFPVLKRWDDGYQTDLSGFDITYTSSDENVATISETGVITIVGGGWAEIRASIAATDMYEADETWFNVEVRPADPYVSISEGAYFTGQKLTLTRVGLSGSMYYSYGYKETSQRTAYDGEISLPAGEYDFYPYTRCGTDEQNIWSYGNAHRMLYVYDQPTINKNSGEYEGDIEVEITNLPESGSVTVYYYFGDDEENAELHTYTAGDKITVRESTKLNVYLLVEGDSGKTHKTEVIERQYVIKDISLAVTSDDFHNHWTTYYNTNGNVALPENENIGAYIASEIGEHTVTVTQIKSIPRGVPVFLNNETTGTTENNNVTGNLLIHADEDVVVDGDFTYYGLYNGMMKRVHGTISAGNNYLLMPTATQPQGAQQLNIVIDNGIKTTISEIEKMRNEGNETYFDLQGRKLSGKPSKEGVYIKNGTKVVLK